jgi:hypothetical protein
MNKAMPVLSIVAFIGFQGVFTLRVLFKYRDQIKELESIFSQNSMAFLYGLAEPWKTKYCWAGFIQVAIIISLLIYL